MNELEQKLRDNNPWKKYEGGSILVDDLNGRDESKPKSKTTLYSVLTNEDNFMDYDLNGNNFIDCPINGDPFNAKIILLFNNPSLPNFTKNRSKDHQAENFDPKKDYFTKKEREIIKDNLTLRSKEMLYTLEDADIINNGYDWYKKMWNSLGITKEQFSKNFCILQWFPYPSKKFHDDFVKRNLNNQIKMLKSHQFIVQLARYAISQGKTVIAMRSIHYWEDVLKPVPVGIDPEDNDVKYSKNYEDNFYFSLDNLNNSLKKEKITLPIKKQINFQSILEK